MGWSEVISAETEEVTWQGEGTHVPGWALALLTSSWAKPRAGTDTVNVCVSPLVYSSLIWALVALVPKLANL